ncbi:hypothetical protein KP509_07G000100 [Ceratopteris richardii]|uniref:Protein kinase domain-containing protein n=1 Tax=Ceratopteris richardii TaxID=49495 RepID=A0A8T2UDT8_CERRI|nr:hypothetical protein KP509_07G000100 [Ceratopteris richardii]
MSTIQHRPPISWIHCRQLLLQIHLMNLPAWSRLCLLLLRFPGSAGAPQCPACGNTTVPYPLSTSSSCGDHNYKVVCNASEGKLSLNVPSGSYPIIAINPNFQSLTIASPSIGPANTCETPDLHEGGLVLNSSLPFNVTSSNTIFLLNCSSLLLQSPLNCTSQSLCTNYLAQDSVGIPCVGKLCCTFTAGGSSTSHVVAVSDAACTAYVSVVDINPGLPVKQWSFGVELQWAAPLEPLCTSQTDCDSLSTCQKDASGNDQRCMCNQGYDWDAISGTCTAMVSCSGDSKCGGRPSGPVIAGAVMGFIAFCAVTLVLLTLQSRRRAAKAARNRLTKERQEILSRGSGGRSAKLFTIQEMKRATRNFARERLLGSGGFGDVYWGVLDDGTDVAVKSAKVGNMKGIDQVLNEVRVLSQVNHRSLVMLLGCCVEAEQPLLVYEYIPNGTLLEHLQGDKYDAYLDWPTRLKVAAQTAEGLSYLHFSANPPIYHRDVKSSNILLDANLNAKVSDFGLSRLAQADLTHISTCAQGTLGYLDPEYYRNYQLTDKSDVYSFGVVLLELVTSQRAIDFGRGQDFVNLAIYVATMEDEGRAMDVIDTGLLSEKAEADTAPAPLDAWRLSSTIDSSLPGVALASYHSKDSPSPLLQGHSRKQSWSSEVGGGGPGDNLIQFATIAGSIRRVIDLALSCLRDSRNDRPSMKEVAEELQCLLQMLNVTSSRDGGGVQFAKNVQTSRVSGVLPKAAEESSGSAGVPSSDTWSSSYTAATVVRSSLSSPR